MPKYRKAQHKSLSPVEARFMFVSPTTVPETERTHQEHRRRKTWATQGLTFNVAAAKAGKVGTNNRLERNVSAHRLQEAWMGTKRQQNVQRSQQDEGAHSEHVLSAFCAPKEPAVKSSPILYGEKVIMVRTFLFFFLF